MEARQQFWIDCYKHAWELWNLGKEYRPAMYDADGKVDDIFSYCRVFADNCCLDLDLYKNAKSER